MTHPDVEAIRKRAEAATSPSWALAENTDKPIVTSGCWPYGKDIATFTDEADAEFCLHAREDIPALLTALAEKDRVIERLSGALRPFAKEADDRAGMSLGPDIDHWPIGFNQLTLGDLRCASEALASLNQASDRTEK